MWWLLIKLSCANSQLIRKNNKESFKVSNIETAEFKAYENIYRSVNIGLVNELKIVSKN